MESLDTLQLICKQEDDVVRDIIPVICSVALEMPTLFPSKNLKILKCWTTDSISYNRKQVACLVAHMFFCTFLPCYNMAETFEGIFVGVSSPTGSICFRFWLKYVMGCTALYLKSLMNYFIDYSTLSSAQLSESVTFNRKYLLPAEVPNWNESEKLLGQVTSSVDGRIGDEEGNVEMDFANKNVGFGTTGTQEELILGTSLEACPIVLFNETLDKSEAILIEGIKKNSQFDGYGINANYSGLPPNRDWSSRKILAMDAYCNVGSAQVQLTDAHLKRELNKAFCAFSMVTRSIIDTGHWGCGAFGGIKAIIQVMAAAEANVSLIFYSFGDNSFNDNFSEVLCLLQTKRVTVSQLWKYMKAYEKEQVSNDDIGIFKWLLKTLN